MLKLKSHWVMQVLYRLNKLSYVKLFSFPDPAPALIKVLSSSVNTAFFCEGINPLRFLLSELFFMNKSLIFFSLN